MADEFAKRVRAGAVPVLTKLPDSLLASPTEATEDEVVISEAA